MRSRSEALRARIGGGLLALSALFLTAGTTGCNSDGSTGSANGTASPVRDPDLDDIPKPSGFSPVRDERTAFWRSGRLRVGQLWFKGGSDPIEVRKFYETFMPDAGYALREMSLKGGEYLMRFESDTEIIHVRCWREKFNTLVVVEFGPQPQGSAPRENPAREGARPPARRPKPAPADE